jgi:single-strand DNA-binding protein
MRNYNKVILIGNVGSTPELRKTKNNISVTNFNLATTDYWKDRNTQESKKNTKWHKIVLWGDIAERACSFIKKGMLVVIEGSLSYKEYNDENGIKRTIAEIKADRVKKHYIPARSYNSECPVDDIPND